MKKNTNGFTLLELMITLLIVSILIWAAVYTFQAVLLTWSSQETRTSIDISLNKGLEMMSIDLRDAAAVQSSSDQIRFTKDNITYYIYYLYNASDAYPPSFNKSSYQLMKATLSGGLGGSFTYGSGQLIMANVVPPPTSDLSLSNNVLNIDITMTMRSESVRSWIEIHPRNI